MNRIYISIWTALVRQVPARVYCGSVCVRLLVSHPPNSLLVVGRASSLLVPRAVLHLLIAYS